VYAAECGWNVTKALSICNPAIAVAVPTTTQHCVTSSASGVPQHCAVTQAAASDGAHQNDVNAGKDAARVQPAIEKLTEQGRLVCLSESVAVCDILLLLALED